MARIRHIAILSDNPEEMKKFYVNVFGLKELDRSKFSVRGERGPATGGVLLSDGEIFVNIVKRMPHHKRPLGFFHLGFHVDSVEETKERLRKNGFSDELEPRPEGVHAQYRLTDPEDVLIDVAETCWEV